MCIDAVVACVVVVAVANKLSACTGIEHVQVNLHVHRCTCIAHICATICNKWQAR